VRAGERVAEFAGLAGAGGVVFECAVLAGVVEFACADRVSSASKHGSVYDRERNQLLTVLHVLLVVSVSVLISHVT
jgi:hypothetical protein